MSMPLFLAFSSNWAWAVCEFWSVRATGRSAGTGVWGGAWAGPRRQRAAPRSAAVRAAVGTLNGNLLRGGYGRVGPSPEFIGPWDEVLPVRSVGVPAVVLPPG